MNSVDLETPPSSSLLGVGNAIATADRRTRTVFSGAYVKAAKIVLGAAAVVSRQPRDGISPHTTLKELGISGEALAEEIEKNCQVSPDKIEGIRGLTNAFELREAIMILTE